MTDKTKQHIEDLYETVSTLRKIIDAQSKTQLALANELSRYKSAYHKIVDTKLEQKDYEYYREGMVKIVKQKDKEIAELHSKLEQICLQRINMAV